jgi:hypothetical protein
MNSSESPLSFFGRLGVAGSAFFRILGDTGFASQVQRLSNPAAPAPTSPTPRSAAAAAAVPKAAELPPERLHGAALSFLSLLQREGRFIDFLQEDLAGFGDADVGAAARAVHAGCRKALTQNLTLEPVLRDAEGASVQVPAGFDANRYRLTGNVAGTGPYRGVLKHHGWVVTAVRLPSLSDAVDPRVLSAAEVELP